MNNEILLAENRLRKNLITIEELIEICQKYTLDEITEVSLFLSNAKIRLKKYLDARPTIKYPVKKYISWVLYTDVEAYEVVRQVSPKVVEVRALQYETIKSPKEFYAGGFSGHYADNYNQQYEFYIDDKAPIQRIHLSSKGWGKGRWVMRDTPYKFYDFNF